MAQLAHELVEDAALRLPTAAALRDGASRITYADLSSAIAAFGAALRSALHAAGCGLVERVAVRLPASQQAVAAMLGASIAGCAFVAIDSGADAQRCAALLRDCGARILVTSAGDARLLDGLASACPSLRMVVLAGAAADTVPPASASIRFLAWEDFLGLSAPPAAARACSSLAALVYRAESANTDSVDTLRGMALSHRNVVAGAAATARCLGMVPGDRLFCTLPLHLDYGLNALLACFAAGATAVLAGAEPDTGDPVLLARMLERGELTGLMAPPPTLAALAKRQPRGAAPCLRFLGCAGGALERADLDALRGTLPRTRIHLLYDVGDACRSTSLMPSQLDERPGSIGRPLPYSDWLLMRPDGRECAAGESGELVRRGALVALGYWNDASTSTERLRPLPATPGLATRETGQWAGVRARRDADGFLYPVDGRSDTILTGGYRVSPREVEKIVVGTGLVAEAAAIGVAHPVLGQVIAVLATPRPGARLDSTILFGACRARLPRHMLPAMVDVRRRPLPRAGDGQIDRARLAGELAPLFAEVAP